MAKKPSIFNRFQAFQETHFPERQIFLRSEGRVRFVTLGGKVQMAATTGLLTLAIWTVITSFNFLTKDAVLENKINQIAALRAEYNSLNSELNALENDVIRRTEILEARQRILEDLSGIEVPKTSLIPAALDLNSDETEIKPNPKKSVETSFLDRVINSNAAYAVALSPSERRDGYLVAIGRLGWRQNKVSSHLLAEVNDQINHIDKILSAAKLSTSLLIDKSTQTTTPKGTGGPFVPDISMMPLYENERLDNLSGLIDKSQRLHLATILLDSIPSGEPAASYYVSSRFGRRRDPMTKKWAQHKALDLAGWPGTAIQASAGGEIVKSGLWGPYGNMIEIDHGNGFKSRYGHMRKLKVKKGDFVVSGQAIGEMGKTGRATSSHLHFEVWFDGKVVDPLPYLKAGNDVLEIQGRASRQADDKADS